MFSKYPFVSIESWELYSHKKRRLLVVLLGPPKNVLRIGQFLVVVVDP